MTFTRALFTNSFLRDKVRFLRSCHILFCNTAFIIVIQLQYCIYYCKTDYIPGLKVQSSCFPAKRNTLCPFQERKAPGQIWLNTLHHLRPRFKVQFPCFPAKRDTLCPSQERKPPGQIWLHTLHHLRSLITFQGSKLNFIAFLRKGTHCVPLKNVKPQGKFDCILCIIWGHWLHSRVQSSIPMLSCEKGHTGSLSGTKTPRANLIAYFASFEATDYIPGFKVQFPCFPAKMDTLCPSQERKAPGQIWLHNLHHLITFQGSKFNSHTFLRKGTHCVPLRNQKP